MLLICWPCQSRKYNKPENMPELPEVETTRRGIEPHLGKQIIHKLIVRQPSLRWPIPKTLATILAGKQIHRVSRRAKYLLISVDNGTLIIHLGMSGSLRILTTDEPAQKHDHVDLVLQSGKTLRYTDPRRFGAWLWTTENIECHTLLAALGPEPLSDAFDGDYLHTQSNNRRLAIKSFLMDSHVVVGVGNIYASESLFMAGIHPARAAGRTSLARYRTLANCVKEVLSNSIRQGGTTLRDFVNGDGKPGYFQQSLLVYGKAGTCCPKCGNIIKEIRIGQRSSFYCVRCQT